MVPRFLSLGIYWKFMGSLKTRPLNLEGQILWYTLDENLDGPPESL
jgi:hypothetical protein